MFFETDFMRLYEALNIANEQSEIRLYLNNILDELSEFDYAFIDVDGKELDDEEAMKAVVQSPAQLEDLGKGVCTDFVEYTCTKLDEREIPHKVYDIVCTDKDGDRPAHVFVVVENEGKFLWLEAAWHSEAGVHEYSSLEELFEDIARKHCIYDGENYLESCEIREIKKSLVGMSQEAIYDYVNTLPITWKAIEEGITEGKNPRASAVLDRSKSVADFIEEYCTPLPAIIPELPAEQAGFKLFATPKFISQYTKDFASKYSKDNLDRWINKVQLALSNLNQQGIIVHKDLNTEKLNDRSLIDFACRFSRIDGTPVRSHRIIVHDTKTDTKYFILATLFMHRKEKWTTAEIEMGNTEYKYIQDLCKKAQ